MSQTLQPFSPLGQLAALRVQAVAEDPNEKITKLLKKILALQKGQQPNDQILGRPFGNKEQIDNG